MVFNDYFNAKQGDQHRNSYYKGYNLDLFSSLCGSVSCFTQERKEKYKKKKNDRTEQVHGILTFGEILHWKSPNVICIKAEYLTGLIKVLCHITDTFLQQWNLLL